MARLRRIDCSLPGYARRRKGRGFEYRDEDRQPIRDDVELARLRALAIPPAWEDVWICADPLGHLQATGIDTAGRKQYLYHEVWRRRRNREKFDRMLEFAAALPLLRRRVETDLAGDRLGRERVLACAARLLDLGFFRAGTEAYAKENGTFGLATLKRRHVTVRDGCRVRFAYRAKGGVAREQTVIDADVHAVVAELKAERRGGPDLLRFHDGTAWRDVRSGDVNDYVREAAGNGFSAKDFRTWHATALAAVSVAVLGSRAQSATARKRAISLAVGEVARYLGNTPAVCRSSYIDPRVFDRFNAGATVCSDLEELADAVTEPAGRQALEGAVRTLLSDGGR